MTASDEFDTANRHHEPREAKRGMYVVDCDTCGRIALYDDRNTAEFPHPWARAEAKRDVNDHPQPHSLTYRRVADA